VLIPPISAFLDLAAKGSPGEDCRSTAVGGGCVLVLLGGGMLVLGQLATIYTLVQYAYLVTLYGLVLAFTGPRAFRLLAMPMLILAFMIPLPQFLLNNLSTKLQLLSSELGVWFMRLFDISVFVEGQRHRPRRLQAAGRRGLRRAALPVSADDLRLSDGLFLQGRDVEAGRRCSCRASRSP
jgi:hypothetical protein